MIKEILNQYNNSKIIKSFAVSALLFTALFSVSAIAYETIWQPTEGKEGKVRFISMGLNESQRNINAAIEFQLTDKWKTYWLSSGDSGLPPEFDIIEATNIKSINVKLPVPKRYDYYDIESYAYEKEVLFPVTIEPIDTSKDVSLTLDMKWAICEDICIFNDNKFTVDLSANNSFGDKQYQKIIEEYQTLVPFNDIEKSDIELKNIKFSDDTYEISFYSPTGWGDRVDISKKFDIFITEILPAQDFSYDGNIWQKPVKATPLNFRFPKPEVKSDDYTKIITFTGTIEKKLKKAQLNGQELQFTLANDNNSVSFTEEITNEIYTASSPQESFVTKQERQSNNPLLNISIWQAIISAVIGGLILNLMPCVLPVLSLKFMSVLKLSSADTKQIRKSFFFTALGIISSFILLAVAVITLKSIGTQIGWGIQFQREEFLIFICFVMLLFTLNQFGYFEILLPQKFSDKLNKSLDSTKPSSNLASFLTGAFATILATPCSAPFLVTAISFAFTQEGIIILLIFFFMAIGMSLPYILAIIYPQIVRIFPKPGAWMVKLKESMAYLLIASIIYFVYVLSAIVGLTVTTMFASFLLITFLFVRFASKRKLDRTKTLLSTIYIISVSVFLTLWTATNFKGTYEMRDSWVKFDQAELEKYIKNGDTIFVDVTADWCLTCQFNKARVVNPMFDFFKQNNVILMKADYTSPSQEIYDYLESFNAYAIPFNVVYGKNAPSGIVLPSLLTEINVKQAIYEAQ